MLRSDNVANYNINARSGHLVNAARPGICCCRDTQYQTLILQMSGGQPVITTHCGPRTHSPDVSGEGIVAEGEKSAAAICAAPAPDKAAGGSAGGPGTSGDCVEGSCSLPIDAMHITA